MGPRRAHRRPPLHHGAEPPGRPVMRLARRGITPSAARLSGRPAAGDRHPGVRFHRFRPRLFGRNQPACMSVRGETPWCLISRDLQMRLASRHTPSIFILRSIKEHSQHKQLCLPAKGSFLPRDSSRSAEGDHHARGTLSSIPHTYLRSRTWIRLRRDLEASQVAHSRCEAASRHTPSIFI